MRELIIDDAWKRHAQERAGRFEVTALDTDAAENADDPRDLVQIASCSTSLAKWNRFSPRL